MEDIQLTAVVGGQQSGQRLDQVLALVFSDYSRSRLQQWIRRNQSPWNLCMKMIICW